MTPAESYLQHSRGLIDAVEAQTARRPPGGGLVRADDPGGADGPRLRHRPQADHGRGDVAALRIVPGVQPDRRAVDDLHNPVVGANGQRQAMFLENVSGLAERILRNFDLSPQDSALAISSSGCNAVTIEMAELFRARGLRVVAIVSRRHSRRQPQQRPARQEAPRLRRRRPRYRRPARRLDGEDRRPGHPRLPRLDHRRLPAGQRDQGGGRRAAHACRPSPKVLSAAAVVGPDKARELFEAAYDEHARRLAKLYANLGS